jgi:hypothetical protein
VTTTFNTGYIESASILVSLAPRWPRWMTGAELWPQRTGLPELDHRLPAAPPEFILALASTDVGYNFAVRRASGPAGRAGRPSHPVGMKYPG